MRELDVIDIAEQSDMKILMQEFVEYYNNPNKDRILNVISLEFSNTKFVFPWNFSKKKLYNLEIILYSYWHFR